VLDRGRAAYAPALERAREELAWERTAAPLVGWLAGAGSATRAGAARPRADLGRRARDLGLRAVLRATGRRWWPQL
jgi:hypothetical protein